MTSDRDRRAYGALLRLAPRPLRERHGAEMEELFLLYVDDARRRGRLAVLAAWARAVGDVAAARTLGAIASRAEADHRPTRKKAFMLVSDFRFAVRTLLRQRGTAALLLAMLALGIGANVTVFSLVNGLFLRPLPLEEPDRLVYVNETAPRWNLPVVGINYSDFLTWRTDSRVFEAIALYDTASFNLAGTTGAERVEGALVTHDFEDALRIRPLLGRSFTPEEDRIGGPPAVVIGHGLWQERFGGRTDVLGQTLRLDGLPRTIVGVLPAAAEFPGRVRLWVPLQGNPDEPGQSYSGQGVARLRPGVTVEQANADLLRAHASIWQTRDKEKIVTPFVRPLQQEFVADFATAASTLTVAVALLLFVACANVASVMLARALARRREMGIRLAVGANRWHLVRQLFVENLVLATVGGALGVLLARWALPVLVAALADQMPSWIKFGLDLRVVAFSIAAVAAAAILFGWAPALHALRDDMRSSLHGGANAEAASTRGRRTLMVLVGGEFALAALLLVCGGLLLRAWDRVRTVDPGFRPQGVLTFTIALPQSTYGKNAQRRVFWDTLLERVRALPGVEAAGLVSCPPLGCHLGNFFQAEGGRQRGPDEPNPVVLSRVVGGDYVAAMGLRLRAGRFLEAGDRSNAGPFPIVVNETFVRTYWPELADPHDALGRRVKRPGKDAPWETVVGVVGDVKHYGLERPMRPGTYESLGDERDQILSVVLRTPQEPKTLVASARSAVRTLDPELAVFQVQTMEEAIRGSLTTRAMYSTLLAVFAATALVLAVGGTYGVTSYLVARRRRELGIRVAVGARRADVVRLVLRGSLRGVAVGAVLGIAASVGAARLMAALLFGVAPYDAAILAGALVVLAATALVANGLPAFRAARVDPMESLRAE
jgi:predicted permease